MTRAARIERGAGYVDLGGVRMPTHAAPADVDWSNFPGGEPARRSGRSATGRTQQVLVRLTPDEATAVVEAAERAGAASTGAWLRDLAEKAYQTFAKQGESNEDRRALPGQDRARTPAL